MYTYRYFCLGKNKVLPVCYTPLSLAENMLFAFQIISGR